MIFELARLESSSSVLAGSSLGAHLHTLVLAEIGSDSQPKDLRAALEFSFRGVDIVTASFLKLFLKPFFLPIEGAQILSEHFSVSVCEVAGDDLRTDLSQFLNGYGLVIAERLENGNVQYLGQLDRVVLDSIAKLELVGATSALELFNRFPENCSNQTTWNNRLIALLRMRLVFRWREGRSWLYQLHFKGGVPWEKEKNLNG